MPGRHVDLGGHAQVRLRAQGHVGAALPQRRAAPPTVLHLPGLAGRPVHLPGHGRAAAPAGIIAATWAALLTTGEEGYLEAAEAIHETAQQIRAAVAGPARAAGVRRRARRSWSRSAPRARADDGGVDIFLVNDALTAARLADEPGPAAARAALLRHPAEHRARAGRGVRPRPGRVGGVRASSTAASRPAAARCTASPAPPAATDILRFLMSGALDAMYAAAAPAAERPGRGLGRRPAWLLAVDLGTSGLKVGAVAESGEILGSTQTDISTDLSRRRRRRAGHRRSGGTAIRAGARELLASGVVGPRRDQSAVGITGQYASTVPVDADGDGGRAVPDLGRRPRRAASTQGRLRRGRGRLQADGDRAVAALHRRRAVAERRRPQRARAVPQARAAADVYARTTVLLEPVDFVGLRFTGRAAATPASMVASWLTDNRHGRRAALRPGAGPARAARRRPAAGAGAVGVGARPGSATSVAAELGLPAGVPVVTGVPDLHAAYLASGAVEDYAAHITISTTSWVSCAVPFKKTDVLHQIASDPRACGPASTSMIDNHETAGVCLQWLRDGVLGHPPGFGPDWSPSYDDLVALAAQAGPGVRRRRLHAVAQGRALARRRPDAARGVPQRVAGHRQGRLRTRRCSRVSPTTCAGWSRRPTSSPAAGWSRCACSAAGAQSDLWCQIHADVLGRRVERVADPAFAQLRGAALYALVALGPAAPGRGAGAGAGRAGLRPGPGGVAPCTPRCTASSPASTAGSRACTAASTADRPPP